MLAVDIVKATGAGLISFLSPCVLPLVPAYLSFVSGVSVDEMKAGGAATRKVAWRALAFILGFTVVFVALGAWGAAMGHYLQPRKDVLLRVAGAVLIIFGLHTMGALRIGLLYREKRAQVKTRPAGFLGAAVVGAAFALGWSPCVVPFLGWIFLLAAKSGHVVHGMVLMSAYSLGLGLPLLAAAVATERFLSVTAGVKKRFRLVEIIAGIILVAAGLSMLVGKLSAWSIWINQVTRGSELIAGVVLYYLAGLALTAWVVQDARGRAAAVWPWAAVSLILGPVGAVAYRLAVRRANARRPIQTSATQE